MKFDAAVLLGSRTRRAAALPIAVNIVYGRGGLQVACKSVVKRVVRIGDPTMWNWSKGCGLGDGLICSVRVCTRDS